MTTHDEWKAELEKDPEYWAAAEKLRPILDLADSILDLRIKRGWTQAELARRARVWRLRVTRLEDGIGNPDLRFLKKLAAALGAHVVMLLEPKESAAREQRAGEG